MHDFLSRPKRHHVKEIPLAPILDLLVVVIFFLILSATFIEMKQVTIPPSSTEISTVPPLEDSVIPLNPKMIMTIQNGEASLLLKWAGANPGQILKKIPVNTKSYDHVLKTTTTSIIKEFKKANPKELKIQLGWQAEIKYQSVLTVVDGIMVEIKDIVFISPEESVALFEKSINGF